MSGKRTLATRLTDISYKIGGLPLVSKSISWRLFWECKVHNFFYSKIEKPYHNGYHWTDRAK